MAGEGSMMHAIITMRNNKRNRKSKLERLKNTSNHREEFIDHKKSSPELLQKIRTKLQLENHKRNHKRNQKAIIKTIILLLLICILIYVINIYWNSILSFF